jgi:hypothetical protein
MAFTDVLCPKLQESLVNIAGDNVGLLNRQPVGFLDALVSSENRQGFSAVPSGEGGRRRTVDVIYLIPDSPSDVTITQSGCEPGAVPNPNDNFCGATRKKEPIAKTVQVCYKACNVPMLLDTADLRKICYTSTDEFRANLIMSMMDALNQAINGQLITFMLQGFGALYGNPTPTGTGSPWSTSTTTFAGNGVNYRWGAELLREYERIGGRRRPIVVGSGDIGLYARILNIGCCNQEGIDLSRAAGEFLYFRDEVASTAAGWGNNHFGVFSPGSVQLLTYVENAGEFRNVGDHYSRDVITDPVTGLNIDANVIYDICENKWRFGICTWFDLFYLPLDMYPSGHNLEKVNGTFRGVTTP